MLFGNAVIWTNSIASARYGYLVHFGMLEDWQIRRLFESFTRRYEDRKRVNARNRHRRRGGQGERQRDGVALRMMLSSVLMKCKIVPERMNRRRPVQNRLANVQSGHQWCIQISESEKRGASTPTRPLKKVKCSLVFDNETQDFNMNLLVFYLINFQLFRRYARRTAYECAPEGNYTYILPSCRRISFASQFYFNSFSLGDFLSRSAHAAQCITHYEYICCGSVFVYLSVCHTYILRWIPCVRGASQNIKLLIIIEWNWSEK